MRFKLDSPIDVSEWDHTNAMGTMIGLMLCTGIGVLVTWVIVQFTSWGFLTIPIIWAWYGTSVWLHICNHCTVEATERSLREWQEQEKKDRERELEKRGE